MISIASIKENIQEIFKNLNITKVVYVDDNISEISIEEVLVSNKRRLIINNYFPKKSVAKDEEIEKDFLREQWRNIDQKVKIEILQLLHPNMHDVSGIDSEAIPAFMELIPENLCIFLSPEHWEKEKNKILNDHDHTLFLFDQDLKIRMQKDDGIRIIKEITKKNDVICGLLTQLVSKEECLNYRRELGQKYNVDENNFFVIPKEDAIKNKSLFLYFLKLAILTRDFRIFKKCMDSNIKKSNRNIKNKVNQVGIEDFDQIIFQIPRNEGMWEPDMFFGIYAGFQRREFIKLAYSDKKLKETISRIRSVSNILTENIPFLEKSKSWKLQQDELYDSPDHLNKNHLPIDIGDIFEKTNKDNGESNYYILLHQPCDLMIRHNGKRSRTPTRVTLVKMKQIEEGKAENKKQQNKIYQQEVWYYGSSINEKWVVNFKDIFLISDFILDLCVYNENGISRYFSEDIFDRSSSLRPSLIERYNEIKKLVIKKKMEGKNILAKVKINGDQEIEDAQNALYDVLFHDDLFNAQYLQSGSEFSITYNCKRIGRLAFDRAVGLLAGLYSVMSRPAYPPDYGERD